VAAVIRYTVKPGARFEYEDWLKRIDPLARMFPGYQGRNIFPPDLGSETYTIILRFDTVEHLRDWLISDTRENFMKEVEPFLARKEEVDIETGLESWFGSPTISTQRHAKPYKRYLLMLLALFPLVVVIPWLLTPLFEAAPFLDGPYIRSLLQAALIVGLVTFVILPRYKRVTAGWLFD
jgi:antibiotic biosynthesis monooxygenase (ABM) superfamily enzyme